MSALSSIPQAYHACNFFVSDSFPWNFHEWWERKKGDDFNADIHEAITQIPAPNKKMKGKIIDIIEKGYKLGEKIIRYPKVVIGN